MVKLVDTLDLGSSIFTDMGVQIPLPAHKNLDDENGKRTELKIQGLL